MQHNDYDTSWDVSTLSAVEKLLRAQRNDLPGEGRKWRDSFSSMRDHFIDAVLPSDDYRWMRWVLRENRPDVVIEALVTIGADVLESAWRLGGINGIRKLLAPIYLPNLTRLDNSGDL
jgi:hypothetical protein